jgi:hypothetical protein
LTAISVAPAFLNFYRMSEMHRFAPLANEDEKSRKKKDRSLKANDDIVSWLAMPVAILVLGSFVAQITLFVVCVVRLSSHQTIRAAEFCGFGQVTLTAAQSVQWSILAFFIPWLTPFLPFLMVAIWKTNASTSWQSHVRNKNLTSNLGKFIFWGYAITLCVIIEQFILNDPSRLLPDDEEVEWSFGQILAVVTLAPLINTISSHLGELPTYPIPAFEPSHSRLTLYLHLISHCTFLSWLD